MKPVTRLDRFSQKRRNLQFLPFGQEGYLYSFHCLGYNQIACFHNTIWNQRSLGSFWVASHCLSPLRGFNLPVLKPPLASFLLPSCCCVCGSSNFPRTFMVTLERGFSTDFVPVALRTGVNKQLVDRSICMGGHVLARESRTGVCFMSRMESCLLWERFLRVNSHGASSAPKTK